MWTGLRGVCLSHWWVVVTFAEVGKLGWDPRGGDLACNPHLRGLLCVVREWEDPVQGPARCDSPEWGEGPLAAVPGSCGDVHSRAPDCAECTRVQVQAQRRPFRSFGLLVGLMGPVGSERSVRALIRAEDLGGPEKPAWGWGETVSTAVQGAR